ncbi:transcriptional regulator ATRX-like [Diorhabda carinulata]|uniref:transcriptional regulator ATRX-like n=1 Tax=Diorhabda carinulata TaxID=1163345 RepID=UPI0025A2AD49|nr:transcriptional regulator ATRX-like [Diorhabda carinulata]
MEKNNVEIAEMRTKFSKIVADILYLCSSLTLKSQKVLSQLEDSKDDKDNSALENIGLKIALILEVLKGNSTVFIDNLLKEIHLLNNDRIEKLFCDMNSKLLECKSNTVIKDSNKYFFAQLVDKETSIDCSIHEADCCNSHLTLNANISSTNSLFSLRREATNDTIKTEDSWEDTLQRTKGNINLKIENSFEIEDIKKKEHNYKDDTATFTKQKHENQDEALIHESGSSITKNGAKENSFNDIKTEQLNEEGKSKLQESQIEMVILSSDDELYAANELTPKKRLMVDSSSSENEQTTDDQSESHDYNAIEDVPNSISNKIITDSNHSFKDIKLEEKACASVDNIKNTEESVFDEKNLGKAKNSSSIDNEKLAVKQETEIFSNISNDRENNTKANKYDKFLEYLNPYSVETEKISSEEEDLDQPDQEKNFLGEHNYNSSPNFKEVSTKIPTLHCLESANIETATDRDSDTLNIDGSNKMCVLENDSNFSFHSDSVSDETICKREKDNNQHIINDHTYFSSSPNYIDTDETDIEKEFAKSDSNVNLVKSSLQIPESEDKEHIFLNSSSNQSFEFDISNNAKLENAQFDNKYQESIDINVKEEKDLEAQDQSNQNNRENEELEEDLLDVTMEEILSDGENKDNRMINGSAENVLNCDVKTEIKEIKLEESDSNDISERPLDEVFENSKIVPTNNVGNELLALFEEVSDRPSTNNLFKAPLITNDSDENVNVDSILQKLQDDDSELSDYISDCSLHSSDIHSNNQVKNLVIDVESDNPEKTLVGDNDAKKDPKNYYNLVDCYVSLERILISKNMAYKVSKVLDDDIDWLCDLKNVLVKIKSASSSTFTKPHNNRRRRRRRKERRSSFDSSGSLSDFTDEENEEMRSRSSSPNLNNEQKERLDEILAAAICNDLKDGSDYSSNTDSSDNCRSKESGKNITDKKIKTNEKLLSKEELEKKAWRNDPLLKRKFSLLESSSDEKIKRKKKGNRYEDDTEFNINSDEIESDSDNQKLLAKNKSKLEDNEISPIKKNIPISDSSDSDSDVQYISPIRPRRDHDDENGSKHSQKGRRNIRSIVSDKCLAQETQQAKKEESERIERLKDRSKVLECLSQTLSSQENEEEKPLVLDINEKTGEILIQVHPTITKKLKPHQRKGIQFMWNSCYESIEHIKSHPGSGCILAHCMGLGKTLQVLSLVHTLFSYEETNTKHVLIVCPLSTVSNWKKELGFALEDFKNKKEISLFTLPHKKNIEMKYEIVKKWYFKTKKSILVLGYEGFETLTNECKLDKKADENLKSRILEALVDPGPSLVVCDEGHLIKNKTAIRTMALNNIKTKRRIVLTGTPLQNNLIEYYHMVHFVKPNLLGTIKEFKTNFVNPITNGQYEDSTVEDIKLMRSRTHVLHKILTETVQRVEDTELEMYLPKMLDHAVFIQLHQVQVNLYNHYSNLVRHNVDKTTGNRFLADFHMFQYLCTHPHLLALMEKSKNKKVKEQDVICEDDEPALNVVNWWKDIMPQDADSKIEYGHKLVVLKSIIEECEAIGDKLLVFSQKIAELDLIEHFLKTIGTKECQIWKKKVDYDRIDGTVSPEYRTNICDNFNNEKNVQCRLLLMSTKVGGLGLNLTAANRVVIMTVHWNPSYDTQSVFRVYRFGQKKKVFVYRLISLDTMEEKVYQRSVTKLAVAHRVVDKHQITRHYKSVDLQEIYSCHPTADNERPTPNVPEDEMLAKLILKLPFIFKYHEHKTLLADRPEDKLTEQEMAAAWEEFKNKDIPKPTSPLPPPPHSVNGPTFQQVYNIGRSYTNQSSTSGQQFSLEKNQYYNLKIQSNAFVTGPLRSENRIASNIFLNNQARSTSGTNSPFSIPTTTYQQLRGIPVVNDKRNIASTKISEIVKLLNNSTVPTNISKLQYKSVVPNVVTTPNHESNKELGNVVQNPFSNEFTSKKTNDATPIEEISSSQVNFKPIKRQLEFSEVINKKIRNSCDSSKGTQNESICHKSSKINNPNIRDSNREASNYKDIQIRDVMSEGMSTTRESSNNNKENSDVITIL